jgi:peptidoglycan/xylan/chitin deacetylase (PgdA/CDA1 family)
VRRAVLVLGGLVIALVGGAGSLSAAPSPTVVTIQFDDGTADQHGALALLNAHGMHATFYVNSGATGDAEHLSWAQLGELAAAGNEIAGHTVTHANVKKLKTGPARQEICGDRVALFDHGFQPVSFAYPFGSFDAGAKAVVAACGYNSGRGVSGGQRPAGLRRDDPATRPVRDAHAAEPEAGDDAGDDRGLRDGGGGERRRLGAARLPPPL